MNVIAPRLAPGRPPQAIHGLIDVDIHPRPNSLDAFKPYLSTRWWDYLTAYGIRARHGYTGGQPVFPKAQPMASRRDAWPPGGTPASDLGFLRTQLLDHHGIDHGILNPLQPSGQGDQNNAFSAAMASAVNDWQIEHWVTPEPRLHASIVVPYEDGAASAAEIRRRARHPGFAQVLMMSRTAEPAGKQRYWPIYEAAQEAGLPVAFHAFGYSGWPMTNGGWPSFYIEEVSEHANSCQPQVTSLVVEGVFEAFPKLRVILIECGWGWLPALSWRLDRHWKTLKSEVPHLTRPPSETIRNHIWVSTQPMEDPATPEQLNDLIEWIGPDKILFASDYPHWDFDDPRHALPSSIPLPTRQAIWGGNARALYGLDGP